MEELFMCQLPSTPMWGQHDVSRVADWGRLDDDDDVFDAWLASVSVSDLERILNHLMEDAGGAATILDSTA
jgi:hypothetical protein